MIIASKIKPDDDFREVKGYQLINYQLKPSYKLFTNERISSKFEVIFKDGNKGYVMMPLCSKTFPERKWLVVISSPDDIIYYESAIERLKGELVYDKIDIAKAKQENMPYPPLYCRIDGKISPYLFATVQKTENFVLNAIIFNLRDGRAFRSKYYPGNKYKFFIADQYRTDSQTGFKMRIDDYENVFTIHPPDTYITIRTNFWHSIPLEYFKEIREDEREAKDELLKRIYHKVEAGDY